MKAPGRWSVRYVAEGGSTYYTLTRAAEVDSLYLRFDVVVVGMVNVLGVVIGLE
jgi:hypothetical protein